MQESFIDIIKCSGCSACAQICPKQCIKMTKDKEGFLYPVVDENICIDCGLCNKTCPILTGKTKKERSEQNAYAAINKNDDIRKESSSGGIFTLIAENVLDKGGVVFGAAFDKDFAVKHIFVQSKEDLCKLRGSKYVQSEIGDCYMQAKEFLEEGRQVLFSGTPCQIGGLYSFLNRDYGNLITQDIICHGVPSPDVWGKYVAYRERKAGAKASKISFRDKQDGWSSYHVSFSFENGTRYYKIAGEDRYINAFLRDYCLRPSCYDCAFKTKSRQADITLADFWGIQSILPDMNDDRGTSLLIINSEKGKTLLKDISEEINLVNVDLDEAINHNISMVSSVEKPKEREQFIKKINSNNFEWIVNRFCKTGKMRLLLGKVKRKIKSLLKK